MDNVDLERAEVERASLHSKDESPRTLTINRIAALRTALDLVAETKTHLAT